jgi:virginiamycin A acetyltransferase
MIDPNKKEINHNKRLCFLKNIITNPNIIVGDYTYYDDPEDVNNFNKNVLYHFDFIGDKLIIGKFCQIATGVRFIMNGAVHSIEGFSTFPFLIFGKDWGEIPEYPQSKGDTVIGNDVWIGNSVTIMPGIKIGDGAILATNAVITKDVEPYTIVGGNPGKVIRKRFDDETTEKLLKLKWWDWPIEKIRKYSGHISKGTLIIAKEI